MIYTTIVSDTSNVTLLSLPANEVKYQRPTFCRRFTYCLYINLSILNTDLDCIPTLILRPFPRINWHIFFNDRYIFISNI